MAVSKRLRFEVFTRDDHTCRYCGADAVSAVLTIDHVQPVALGGSDVPSNLVTACADCNAGKSSVPPNSQTVEDVAEDAMRWSAAMQQAAQEMARGLAVSKEYEDAFLSKWESYNYGRDEIPVPYSLDWRTKIRSLYEIGLPLDVLLESVEIAMASKASPESTFRYFCGVTRNKVQALQERARDLIEGGGVHGA